MANVLRDIASCVKVSAGEGDLVEMPDNEPSLEGVEGSALIAPRSCLSSKIMLTKPIHFTTLLPAIIGVYHLALDKDITRSAGQRREFAPSIPQRREAPPVTRFFSEKHTWKVLNSVRVENLSFRDACTLEVRPCRLAKYVTPSIFNSLANMVYQRMIAIGRRTVLNELSRFDWLPILEATGALVAIYDGEDRLLFANHAFRMAWFIEEEEQPLWPDLMRRNFQAGRGTVIKSEDFETWLNSTRARRGKTGFRAFETDLHDGRWLWMTESMQPNGWMLCIASDITSIRSDERSLRQDRDEAIRASLTDELTGMPSRRYVMTKLSELLDDVRPDNDPLGCVAILDIDNFKYINDRFGHSTGDAVLRDFAATLQQHVRKTDVLGRVGGA